MTWFSSSFRARLHAARARNEDKDWACCRNTRSRAAGRVGELTVLAVRRGIRVDFRRRSGRNHSPHSVASWFNDHKGAAEFRFSIQTEYSLPFGMDSLQLRWQHPQIQDPGAQRLNEHQPTKVTVAPDKNSSLHPRHVEQLRVGCPRTTALTGCGCVVPKGAKDLNCGGVHVLIDEKFHAETAGRISSSAIRSMAYCTHARMSSTDKSG